MSSVRITCNIFIIAYILLHDTVYKVSMVDRVVRPQFRCDKHNTKFQHHENLSLLSSHRNMRDTFPIVLSKKGDKYHPWDKRITNRNVVCL